jgi:hypothetical protein
MLEGFIRQLTDQIKMGRDALFDLLSIHPSADGYDAGNEKFRPLNRIIG